MSPGATAIEGASMQAIDDDYLAGVKTGAAPWVMPVLVSLQRPHLDIEIISDPYVDAPLFGNEQADADTLSRAFLRRYKWLREPFGEVAPPAVLMRGTCRVDPAAALDDSQRKDLWARACDALRSTALTVLDVSSDEAATGEVAAVFQVSFAGPADVRGTSAGTLAYVVVVGWPACDAADEVPRLPGAERLILALADSIAMNTPVHLIGVAPGRLDESSRAACQRLQMSLVLDGASHQRDFVTLSRTLLGPHTVAAATEVSVVHCPGFKGGVGRPGLARVSVNVWRGEAEIAFRHDLGSDRSPRPLQVIRPVVSASRVTSTERRLYNRVHELIDKEQADAALKADHRDALTRFRDHVETIWRDTGYAALCKEDDKLPLRATRHTEYNLLLLLRERDGGYDILLSNHSPMRPSQLSDWNTLLVPAVRDVRELLGNLSSDVLRQLAERADDFERAEHAQAFQRAVESILAEEGKPGDDLWADELREVANKKIRKISPTSGAVTEYDYHLVTLLPLIDRSVARAPDDGAGTDDTRRRQKHKIIAWLESLDTVTVDGDGSSPARGLAAEALFQNGAGLRWDPKINLVELPRAADRLRSERAFPGAVWFPLIDRAGKALWRHCPAVLARNADVMSWVEEQLAAKRFDDGSYPTELVLGRHPGESETYEVVGPVFPFEGEGPPVASDEHAPTTIAAIRRVEFLEGYDLEGKLAYPPDARVLRVFLARGQRETRAEPRAGIFVYEAERGQSAADAIADGRVLGMLRPVQRYVLTAGLKRAAQINRLRSEALPDDEWGFVRVRKGGAPRLVTVTPPIIEELQPADLDDCEYKVDFVVCDGNHRIVDTVWTHSAPLAAVAVMGTFPEPYYARPFGRLEWDATAENELFVAPPLAAKYLPRTVTLSGLDDIQKTKLLGVSERDRFRRYYRDLTKGFGYMGGQGGAFV